MARFHDGQTVICVRGGAHPGAARRYPGLRWPVTGRRYVIRCAEIPQRSKLTFVLLSGLSNRKIRWPCGLIHEAAFWEERFEPATDIGELDAVRKEVEMFMGDDGPKVDHKVRRRKREDA